MNWFLLSAFDDVSCISEDGYVFADSSYVAASLVELELFTTI